MVRKKKNEDIIGIGRRKTAVASVRLRKGKGKIDVNGKDFENYFASQQQRNLITFPLEKFSSTSKYDIFMRLKGGGLQAQAEAARLGIARALVKQDEDLRGELKELGLLRRDPRKKERKKYGLAKARKKFQFSKR